LLIGKRQQPADRLRVLCGDLWIALRNPLLDVV